jgi:hypothetical protein
MAKGAFSGEENGGLGVGVSITLRKTVNERATLYLAKIAKITLVDTQSIRAKLLRQLEGLFDLVCCVSKGKLNGSEMRTATSTR